MLQSSGCVTITIRDGVRSKEYRVFRSLLTWHSSSCAAALSPTGVFRDRGASSLEFIENVEVFDAFSCWLYTGKLDETAGPIRIGCPPHFSPLTLCGIWIFARECAKKWQGGTHSGLPARCLTHYCEENKGREAGTDAMDEVEYMSVARSLWAWWAVEGGFTKIYTL
jgi:hypothetical protein